MYSDENYEEYNDDNYQSNYQSNYNSGLVIKIIIIIICMIVLVWLILALKNRKQDITYNPQVHQDNIQKVRLAAEKYFFDEKLPTNGETNNITLNTLINNKLLDNVVDSNNKVCNEVKSVISIKDASKSYELKIKLSCSSDEKEEYFYYMKNNHKCLNCGGITNVHADITNNTNTKTQKSNNDSKKDTKTTSTKSNSNNNSNKNTNNSNTTNSSNNTKTDNKDSLLDKYSCNTWSSWTKEKINDERLDVMTRYLYKGVKKGKTKEVTTYGKWSKYSTKKPTKSSIEIRKKTKTEKVWSENKTTTNYIKNSDKIKVVDVKNYTTKGTTYCPKGYKKDGKKCVSKIVYIGDLNYLQYNTYKVYNKSCESVKLEKNSQGKYEKIYKNCHYSLYTDMKKTKGTTTTIYTYQELISKKVTYYSYRTVKVKKIKEDDIYTDKYYEEKDLPKGYTKDSKSKIVEYAYRIKACEK